MQFCAGQREGGEQTSSRQQRTVKIVLGSLSSINHSEGQKKLRTYNTYCTLNIKRKCATDAGCWVMSVIIMWESEIWALWAVCRRHPRRDRYSRDPRDMYSCVTEAAWRPCLGLPSQPSPVSPVLITPAVTRHSPPTHKQFVSEVSAKCPAVRRARLGPGWTRSRRGQNN